jgi:hypothetical protein
MIGKKVPKSKAAAGQSKAQRIRGLADYITSPERNGAEKCIASGTAGEFLSDDMDTRIAEMQALSDSCVKSSDTISHYVISWPQNEQPTVEQARAVVDIVRREMNIEHLQLLWGLHKDTENSHVHLMVNRVNPQTERAHRLNYEVNQLQAAVAVAAHELGFAELQNGRFVVDESGKAQQIMQDRDKPRTNQRAKDNERRTGQKSAIRVAQEQARPIIKQAETWEQLHRRLAEIGMRYEKKGSGAMILVGDTPVKASDVNRDCSLGQLQKRLGDYQPAPDDLQLAPAPAPQPVNQIASQLGFSEYSKEREKARHQRLQGKKKLDETIKRERDELFQKQKQERKQVLKGNWQGKGAALNAMRSVLAAKQAAERAELLEQQQQRRAALRKEHQHFPDFENWLLQKRGKEAAEIYRNADSIAFTYTNDEKQATAVKHDIRSYEPIIKGAIVSYADKKSGNVDFVDKGKRIELLKLNDDDAMLSFLQLSQQRYGKNLHLFGNDEFKAHAIKIAVANNITIANPELQQQITEERERQQLVRKEQMKSEAQKQFDVYHKAINADTYRVSSRHETSGKNWVMTDAHGVQPDRMEWYKINQLVSKNNEHLYLTPLSKNHHLILVDDTNPEKIEQMRAAGFPPAFVQKSSANSWQAIVKVPRLEVEPEPGTAAQRKSAEYKASVKLAQELNKQFGDPELTNAIQPHRMPGTKNVKEKHRREDGTFPSVEIVYAGGDIALNGRTRLEELTKATREHDERVERELREKERAAVHHNQQDQHQLYTLFERDIERKILKGRATDRSALDFMIATRLRAIGMTQTDIATIIEQSTPRAGRQHDWSDYARRTAAAAYSPRGDTDLGKTVKYHSDWQNLAKTVVEPERGPSIKVAERDAGKGKPSKGLEL